VMRRRVSLISRGALAVVGLAGLVTAGIHAARSTSALAGAAQVALARRDDGYYGCLETQVRSLVPKDSPVVVDTDNLGDYTTLGKVVAMWARMVPPGSTYAVAELSLAPHPTGPVCLGSAVKARFRSGRVSFGTGASMPGEGPPPPTPL
jgi:hypothetical protein